MNITVTITNKPSVAEATHTHGKENLALIRKLRKDTKL